MEWISVLEKLPELDKEILCYYEMVSRSKETYKHFVIGRLEEVSNRSSGITTSWRDQDWNYFSPSHWMPLPEPPTTALNHPQ